MRIIFCMYNIWRKLTFQQVTVDIELAQVCIPINILGGSRFPLKVVNRNTHLNVKIPT